MVASLALTIALAAPIALPDWPRFLGPTGDGVAPWPEPTFTWPVGGPEVLWRVAIGEGFAGVAVAGDEVCLLDREGEEALQTAATNAVTLPVLGGVTRSIDVIRWDLAQARHVEASAAFGAMLEQDLRGQIRMSAQARRAVPMRVLTSVNMPAALIEMAYLTNGDEERLVRSDDYQASLVQGIYNAVVRFRGYLEQRGTP